MSRKHLAIIETREEMSRSMQEAMLETKEGRRWLKVKTSVFSNFSSNFWLIFGKL